MARLRESVSVWLPGCFKFSTSFSSFSIRSFIDNLFRIELAQLNKIKPEQTINSRYAHQCASLQPVRGLTIDGNVAIRRENPMMYSITYIYLLSLNINITPKPVFLFSIYTAGRATLFAVLKSAQIPRRIRYG